MCGVWRWCLLHTFHPILSPHSWRLLNIFDHLKSKCLNMNHIESWNSGKKLPTCPLQTSSTMKTSLHFISMLLRPHWWQINFLSFSKVCSARLRPRPIITSSLLTPRSRDKRSSERGRDKGNVTRISSVWCVVPSVADCAGGGGLIPCHNICQTLALTMARRRVVTGDNGGLTFYIFVLLDISNTCSVAEKWRIMIFAQRWADWAELRGDEFLARKQG